MAKSKSRKYVVELELENGKKVTAELKTVNNEVEKLDNNLKGSVEVIDDITGGFGGWTDKARKLSGGIKKVTKGLGTLKGAILATGIGALILALTSVTTWFTQTAAGSDKLRTSTAKLGGVWDEIKIKFAEGGEAIVEAIENPGKAWDDFKDKIDKGVNVVKALFTLWINDWKIKTKLFEQGVLNMRVRWNEFTGDAEEAQKLTDAVSAINDEIKGLVKENVDAQITIAATAQESVNALQAEAAEYAKRQQQRQELAEATIALEKRERALTVATAERRAEIERQKFIADDITKTETERQAAAQTAFALENKLMSERESLQKERIRLMKIELETTLTSNEDLDNLAQAEAELANIQQESTTRQIELNNKLNAIRQEGLRKQAEADAEYLRVQNEMEEVRLALITEGVDKELAEADRKYEELFLKANGNAELEKQLIEAQESEIAAIRKRYQDEQTQKESEEAQKRANIAKQEKDAKLKTAGTFFGGVAGLAEALSEGEGARAKQAFQVSKALRIAEASANTYTAVTAALAEPTPGRIPRAIAAGAMGLAQVLKIKNTKFEGGGSGGGSISAPSSPVSSQTQQTAQAPQIDFSFLEEQPPAQAYVLSGNVNSQLEANQKIQDQATL